MPTADALREAALEFARGGIPAQDGVMRLLELCGGRQVAMVLARQQLLEDAKAHPDDPSLTRATELLDGVLERLPLE